ncbi:MAG TPA: PLP-dependent aminotransferase family protein [Geobacteraceae bacterium]
MAARIGAMIANGTYRPGERVPSVRGLSRQMRVSVNTVLQSYAHLENAGLIEARPQSGYYVCSPLPASEGKAKSRAKEYHPPSDVVLGDTPLRIMRSIADSSLVPLGRGVPNLDFLPADKLNRMLATETRRFGSQALSYAPAQGLRKLRLQIAKRSVSAGCTLQPDDIVITSGCVEAVTLALQAVCRPGDTVAIASPVYYTFLNSIQWLGLKVLEIPANGEGMSLDVLDYALKRTPVHACLTIANFNNPLGTVMPDDRKRDLVRMLAHHDIPLIEDDVYGDLAFGASRPSTTKAYDEKGLVLYCSSFSKTLAPGYRVGWIVPGRFRERIEHLKALFNIATATPTQLAIAEFLANGGYDHHLRKIRRIYARQVGQVRDAILHHFPVGTRVSRPDGGFVLWVEMPEEIDAMRLFEEALRKGIGIAPGPLFTIGDRFRNCVRVSAAFWNERIEEALATLGEIAREISRSV